MPIAATAPYDTAQTVIQQAIVRSGDQASPNGIAGNILNPTNQAWVIALLSGVYRDLQDRLISKGVETYSQYFFITGIPPANTVNPSQQVYLNYNGYFDGQQMNANWYLPPNMVKPLEIWERQTGNNYWVPMTQVADSISTRPIMPRISEWDWEAETLYLPPWNETNDLKIKGLMYAPDLTATSSPVLVARCQTALAYLLLVEVAKQRGGLEMAAVWQKDADNYVEAIVNRTARKEAYGSYSRIPFRRRRSARGRDGN